jgi:hypothetical protein
MVRNRLLVTFTLCTMALALGQSRAQAQVKPFKITGGGIGPNGIPLPGQGGCPHSATGNATHLGKYSGEGQVETDTATFLPNGDITGEFGSPVPFVFTAANGDQLACFYGRTDHGATTPGTFTLVPLGGGTYVAFFVAEFVPYLPECTGKFAGVSGGWIMYAMSDPFVLGSDGPVGYTWEGEGSLTFSEGN